MSGQGIRLLAAFAALIAGAAALAIVIVLLNGVIG